MGQTINKLSTKQLTDKAIFNNRFVIEICEKIHLHYRNLRIILSQKDWMELALGIRDALFRWERIGKPETGRGVHIELCRKQVAQDPLFDTDLAINENRNLYLANEGKIFSEGAELDDKTYIHVKLRDLRLELRPSEFLQLADAFAEAKEKLCVQQS